MRPPILLQTIPTRSIDCPDSFLGWLDQEVAEARPINILQRFGQTIPLLIWQHASTQPVLLTGYPIFQAIKDLGFEQTHCLILPKDTPPLYRYSLQIVHDLVALQASPILQAYLLRQARENLVDDDLYSLLPLLGYKPHRAKIEELDTLLSLCPATILACHRGLLSARTAGLMHRLSPPDQEVLTQLVESYRPGGSKQFKLVEMVTELVLRNGTSVQELVGPWLTDNEHLVNNRPQRTQGILQMLAARCWPEKTRLERQFQQLVRRLNLPEGVTISPSAGFEDDSVEVRLRFADTEQFLARWDSLQSLFNR